MIKARSFDPFFSFRTVAGYIWLLLCLLWLILPIAVCLGSGSEFIEFVIPLRSGKFYSLRSFLEESNRKLGTTYPLDKIGDREIELRDLEKAAILLVSDVGLFQAKFEPDRLVLSIPDRQDDRSRRNVRDRLSRIFRMPLNEWPAHLGLHVPKNFDSSRRTILLTHGLESGAANLQPMQLVFEHQGVQVLTFDFPNDGPLAWSGDRLSDELKELVARHPGVKLAVVAHSMGGLVVRYALETPGKNAGCVTDLFLLATPNAGSKLAAAQPWLEMIQQILPGPRRLSGAISDGLGEAADDLQPGSRFLTTLNAHRRTPQVRYHSIMGRKAFVSDEERSRIESELIGFLERRDTPEETIRTIRELLDAEELRQGSGDGAVALRSARLAGVSDEMVLDLTHVELLDPGRSASDGMGVIRWILNKLGWEG